MVYEYIEIFIFFGGEADIESKVDDIGKYKISDYYVKIFRQKFDLDDDIFFYSEDEIDDLLVDEWGIICGL